MDPSPSEPIADEAPLEEAAEPDEEGDELDELLPVPIRVVAAFRLDDMFVAFPVLAPGLVFPPCLDAMFTAVEEPEGLLVLSLP